MAGSFSVRRTQVEAWLDTLGGKIAVSSGLHLLVFFLAANAWWIGARKLRPVGTPAGSQRMLLYEEPRVGTPSAQVRKPPIHTVRTARNHLVAPVQVPTLAEAAAAGSDQALGNGEVSITYVRAFPDQKPNLEGTGPTGDVLLDVEIDAAGHIARIRTRSGISETIDRTIIATVEQWVFQPTMRNGHPVSSSEELHFHFDRSRNPAGCGWECFTLEAQ